MDEVDHYQGGNQSQLRKEGHHTYRRRVRLAHPDDQHQGRFRNLLGGKIRHGASFYTLEGEPPPRLNKDRSGSGRQRTRPHLLGPVLEDDLGLDHLCPRTQLLILRGRGTNLHAATDRFGRSLVSAYLQQRRQGDHYEWVPVVPQTHEAADPDGGGERQTARIQLRNQNDPRRLHERGEKHRPGTGLRVAHLRDRGQDSRAVQRQPEVHPRTDPAHRPRANRHTQPGLGGAGQETDHREKHQGLEGQDRLTEGLLRLDHGRTGC